MRALAIYWIAFGFVLLAVLVAHDALLFDEVRHRVNASLLDLSPSEARPNAAVRSAFHLDDAYFVEQEAFSLYRDEFFRRDWEKVASFHSHKVLAWLPWSIEVRLSFDRRRLESFRLRKLKAELAAMAAFGRSLNELDAQELACIARRVRAGNYEPGRRPLKCAGG